MLGKSSATELHPCRALDTLFISSQFQWLFYLSGLQSSNADAVELDLTALPVCGAAHKGEHCVFRGK
jgi:hypothetical protein